jgi:hypothetical protein
VDAEASAPARERGGLDVAEGVVGHQPPGRDLVLVEGASARLEEAGDGLRPFVSVQLDVGEPRVVDDHVCVVVADARLGLHPAGRMVRAVAGDGVAGPQEARVAGDVRVQQVAGTGLLVAVAGLLRGSRRL